MEGAAIEDGRRALQQALAGPFVFTPIEEDGVAGYEFKAPTTVGEVIAGAVQANPQSGVPRWKGPLSHERLGGAAAGGVAVAEWPP
jgi:hypothetical protein